MEATLNGPFGVMTLSTHPLTIGRAPDNKLVLNDARASSHHAVVRGENGGYAITDLGSTNGTFVNEQQLRSNEPRQLNTGDILRIGDIRISYESNDAQQGATSGYAPTIAIPSPAQAASSAGQPYIQNPPPLAQPAPNQASMNAPYPLPSHQQPNAQFASQAGAPPYGYQPVAAPRRSNRGLFITFGAVAGGLILLCFAASLIVFIVRSTPGKTLNTYCDALKSGDYQTAYNQLSNNVQAQESEAQFASAFTVTRIKIVSCKVGNTSDDGTVGVGSMSYTTNIRFSGIDDFRLIQENGTWKINNVTTRK